MGEIAEALKRSREERETRQAKAPEESRSAPAAPVPPGRSELMAALDAAKRESGDPAPAMPAEPGRESSADAAKAPVPEEVLYDLEEAARDSIGPVEMHRQLALQVASQLEHRSARSLAVVSALRDEGKTTVACTLAVALASVRAERSVALVDLDLRNPSVGRRLGLRPKIGIESCLLGRAELEDVRVSLRTPLLDVYPSVEHQRAAHELLARPQLAKMLRTLERRYATVIIDTPPTLIVPDASLLIKQGPCCITVARSGTTRVKRFEEMLDLLPDDAVVGKVLNSATLPNRDKNYYEYSYGPESEAAPDEIER